MELVTPHLDVSLVHSRCFSEFTMTTIIRNVKVGLQILKGFT